MLPKIDSGESENIWINIFDEYFPNQIKLLENTPQDEMHHAEGDVWTHTKMVVNQLLNHIDYDLASDDEKQILILSAMLHDISKPQTTKSENGKITALGHSRKGAIYARKKLWELDLDIDIREAICRLISYHQNPFHAFSNRDGTSAEFIAKKISYDCNNKLLITLAECDILGRICQDQKLILDNIELYKQQCIELECLDKSYNFFNSKSASRYILSKGQKGGDFEIYSKDDFDVFMLSGMPASGKDTYCSSVDLPMISYDLAREKLNIKYGQENGKIIHYVQDEAREYLRKKQSFIINATHLSQGMRDPMLDLIRQYNGSPNILCFESNLETLIERNENRNSSLPSNKIITMLDKWEYPWNWEADSVKKIKSNLSNKFKL